MDRDRQTDFDTGRTIPRDSGSVLGGEAAPMRAAGRDVAGDALHPTDEDLLLRSDTVDTTPSRATRDPRELSADEKTRLSVSTSNPIDLGEREERLFGQIHSGMRVIDANGEDLGKVELMMMGDPEAATTEGRESSQSGGIVGSFSRALTGAEREPDVPEPLRSHLLRIGFIKVDGKGWFDTDRYLTADQIATVTNDEVRLAVTRDAIPNNKGKDR